MAKRRLVVAAAILFFFGLPLAGILLPYRSIHVAMRASGEKFLREAAPTFLKEDGWPVVEGYGTLTLKNELDQQTFEGWIAKVGSFKEFSKIAVTRSWVSTRGDQGWQFVSFKCQVLFTKQSAPLKITVARRSIALDEWRVESIAFPDVNVE